MRPGDLVERFVVPARTRVIEDPAVGVKRLTEPVFGEVVFTDSQPDLRDKLALRVVHYKLLVVTQAALKLSGLFQTKRQQVLDAVVLLKLGKPLEDGLVELDALSEVQHRRLGLFADLLLLKELKLTREFFVGVVVVVLRLFKIQLSEAEHSLRRILGVVSIPTHKALEGGDGALTALSLTPLELSDSLLEIDINPSHPRVALALDGRHDLGVKLIRDLLEPSDGLFELFLRLLFRKLLRRLLLSGSSSSAGFRRVVTALGRLLRRLTFRLSGLRA